MNKTLIFLLTMSAFCGCNNTQTSPSSSEGQVAEAVTQLMKGIEEADETLLNRLAAEELVYGHSSGKVQNKAEFVAEIISGQPLDYSNIELIDQTIKVVNETAIVRHVFTAETRSNDVAGRLRIGNVLIWQRQKGAWRLLARQAYALPAAARQNVATVFEGSADVGNPALKGSFSYDEAEKKYTLTGAGTNMWLQSDEFFMVWKKETGDFSLSAKVAFEGKGVNAHRKLGLIIRESLTGESKYADVAIHGDGLTSLQYRDTTGGETREVVATNRNADHITLERTGNRIVIKTGVGQYAPNATAEVEIDLPETCYIGLFVCSHEPDVLETAYFWVQ
jgi:hypothetical protein